MNSSDSKKCALCSSDILAENDSADHLIPSSIGGRKIVYGFLCKKCNSQYSQKSEAELAKQLNWLSLCIGIKRESRRSQPPSPIVQTASEDHLLFRADGTLTAEHTSFTKEEGESSTQLTIQAKITEEARKILRGVVKKYQNIDIETELLKAIASETPLDSPIKMDFCFGGPFFGQSIVKTAFAMASNSGVPHDQCDKAIDYLKGLTPENNAPYTLFYLSDLVENRPTENLFHCVSLIGESGINRLICYVEYFGFARLIVDLSSHYTGPEILQSYAIDPSTGQELNIQVNMKLTELELNKVLDNQSIPLNEYIKAINGAAQIAHKLNCDRERDRIVSEAAEYAFECLNVIPGDQLPKAEYEKFVALMMEKIAPFLARHKLK